MSFLSILASTRNLITFHFTRPLVGDNALATLKDVNQVVDQLNGFLPYSYNGFLITQTALLDPVLTQARTIRVSNVGTPTTSEPCNCLCNFPISTTNNLSQYNGSCKNFCCHPVARINVGTYSFTVGSGADFDLGLLFQPFSNVDHHVTINRLPNVGDDAVFSIKTYSGAVLTDGIFNNTYFELKMFTTV